jgi:putative hydrolase of the HAD superfamily
MGDSKRQFAAVLWDFGGVVTTSPFEAFNRMEAAKGLPHNLVRQINAADPDGNAWARFERAEIDAAAFDAAFAAEAAALGHDLPGRDVIACLAGDIRPRMLTALDWLKGHGFALGCITNNVPAGKGAGMAMTDARAAAVADALARFDHVIESSKVGVRKPDPAIYRMMCDTIGVARERCIYLDDLGINCKPAAMLGMHAIKVTGEAQALADLAAALGLPADWP